MIGMIYEFLNGNGLWPSNLLCIFWFCSAVLMLMMHTLMTSVRFEIPKLLKDLYFFGKVKATAIKDPDTFLSSVPKGWFLHFYLFGFMAHSFLMLCVCLHICGVHFELNRWMLQLATFESSEMKTETAWLPVLAVLLMEWIQMCRRLYECLFVSSFSKNTMSVLHYAFGVFFYVSFGLGLVVSADLPNLHLGWYSVREVVLCVIGFSIFAVASYGQHASLVIFASLRRTRKDGKKDGHYIPRGGLFELISSPHYVCEILIYFSFSLVFGFKSLYLNAVFSFVLSNQVIASLTVHAWNKKVFANYPPHRKAIIPYIW